MNSEWNTFITYFKSKPVGSILTAKEINAALVDLYVGTRWGYFSLLRKAKFIQIVKKGHYKITEAIPDGLNVGSIKSFIKGDNLSYIESINKRKEKDVLSVPYNEERRKFISILIEESNALLEIVDNAEYISKMFGLDFFNLRQQIVIWNSELKETKSPTKTWLEHKLSETIPTL